MAEKIVIYCGSLEQLNSEDIKRLRQYAPKSLGARYVSGAHTMESLTEDVEQDLRKKRSAGIVDARTFFAGSWKDHHGLTREHFRIEGTPVVRDL